ncbi:MAG: hypothetical protein Q9181_007729 [Wetmoreana brouardii]
MDIKMDDTPVVDWASNSRTGVPYLPSLAPTVPYLEKLPEQSSTINNAQQTDCARPTETITNVNQPYIDAWQNLTNLALLANKGAGWRAAPTQAEQRKLLRDRRQEKRLARDQHIARRDNVMTVTGPPTRRIVVAARQQIKEEKQALAAKKTADRISKFKTAITSRAKETATAQGLERALEGLDLNASSGDTDLCKDHPQKAKTAFNILQKHHENSNYPQVLDDEETERYITALRDKYAEIKGIDLDAVPDLEDGGVSLPAQSVVPTTATTTTMEKTTPQLIEQLCSSIRKQPPPTSTTPTISPQQWIQENYTRRQQNKDNQTAADLQTYRRNPSIESQLSKKRRNRLHMALQRGRTDFNLMRLEKRRVRLEEMWKQGKKTKYDLKGKEHKRRNVMKATKRVDSYRPVREGKERLWHSHQLGRRRERRAGAPAPTPEIAEASGPSRHNPVDDKPLSLSALSRAIIDPLLRAEASGSTQHNPVDDEPLTLSAHSSAVNVPLFRAYEDYLIEERKKAERETDELALEEGMRRLDV